MSKAIYTLFYWCMSYFMLAGGALDLDSCYLSIILCNNNIIARICLSVTLIIYISPLSLLNIQTYKHINNIYMPTKSSIISYPNVGAYEIT